MLCIEECGIFLNRVTVVISTVLVVFSAVLKSYFYQEKI